jgi:hypothetical protein
MTAQAEAAFGRGEQDQFVSLASLAFPSEAVVVAVAAKPEKDDERDEQEQRQDAQDSECPAEHEGQCTLGGGRVRFAVGITGW